MGYKYQKCPICDGAGLLNRPPWVAGDQQEWSTTDASPYTCHGCQGSGLLNQMKDERCYDV